MLIFGTRPEAIKMAPLVKALQESPKVFTPIVYVSMSKAVNPYGDGEACARICAHIAQVCGKLVDEFEPEL